MYCELLLSSRLNHDLNKQHQSKLDRFVFPPAVTFLHSVIHKPVFSFCLYIRVALALLYKVLWEIEGISSALSAEGKEASGAMQTTVPSCIKKTR